MSIGLHRDGKHFRLSLFDAEIRRRVWWYILKSDGRVAEDHGLLMVAEAFCDTSLPSNIDDSDISPETSVLPPLKDKWTEMMPFLITAETNRAFQHIYRPQAGPASATDIRINPLQLFKDVKDSIETKYLRHCNPNIPVQRFAILVAGVLLGKLEFLGRLQLAGAMHNPGASSTGSIHPDEETLSLAVDTLYRGHEMYTDDLLLSFRWHSGTYPPYHFLTYTLWHLSICPNSPIADRAWSAVNQTFDLIENDPFWPDPAPKWSVLQKLREKALNVRLSRETINTTGAYPGSRWSTRSTARPNVEPQGRMIDPTPDLIPSGAPLTSDVIFGEGLVWDLDSISFPGWMNFAHGLE
jgi:hypothetical protein